MNFHHKINDAYFISDLHFNHKNICSGTSQWHNKHNCRPFQTLDDMNEAILNSILSHKSKDLFILGDILFGDKTALPFLINEFRQNYTYIHLVFGNHDDYIRTQYIHLFDSTWDYLELSYGKKLICLSHYPILNWRDHHKGSYHLYGHEHGGLSGPYTQRRCLDLGWDIWGRPVHIEEIDQAMKAKSTVGVGHHV